MVSPQTQAISTLDIPRSLKSALHDAGYKTKDDIREQSANDLSAELGISRSQAEDLLHQIATDSAGPSTLPKAAAESRLLPHSQIQASTAADLLSSAYLPHFSTSSTSVDHLIAHFQDPHKRQASKRPTRKGKEKEASAAITPGMTVEIAGPPGIGKTSMALAVVLSARLTAADQANEEEEAESGEVLIIDSEGGITAERVRAAAGSLTRTRATLPRDILHGIHLVRIPTQTQMIAFLNTLDEWLESHPKVNLVVIDTLSYHFRQPSLDMSTRRRMMELVKQKIGQATTIHRCAVIVCNQMATKLLTAENKPANFDTGDRAILMPQLGDSWTTGKTLRLCLFRGQAGDELRYVHAEMAGSSRGLKWAAFDIDDDGLPCDIPEMMYDRPKTPPFVAESELDF